MKFAKKIYALICDDIRYEEGGKISLMGLYAENIHVKQIPSIIPTLGIMIVMEELKEPLREISIIIEQPKTKPSETTIHPPANQEFKDGESINVRMLLQISPFRVETEGKVKISVKLPQENKKRVVHTFEIINKEQID